MHEGIDLAALFFNLVAVELIFDKSVGFFLSLERRFLGIGARCASAFNNDSDFMIIF